MLQQWQLLLCGISLYDFAECVDLFAGKGKGAKEKGGRVWNGVEWSGGDVMCVLSSVATVDDDDHHGGGHFDGLLGTPSALIRLNCLINPKKMRMDFEVEVAWQIARAADLRLISMHLNVPYEMKTMKTMESVIDGGSLYQVLELPDYAPHL